MILSILFTFIMAHADDDHDHKKPDLTAQCTAGEPSCNHEDNEKDEHGHDHDESEVKEDEHGHNHAENDEHSDEHGHSDDHGGEEENGAIGPDKGITAKSANGFKLSQEAIKSFALKTEPLNSETVETSEGSLVTIKDFKGVYRVRDQWIKRVPVKVLSKKNNRLTIEVSERAAGDQIVTQGAGFLRGAELVVEEGVSHGHSH